MALQIIDLQDYKYSRLVFFTLTTHATNADDTPTVNIGVYSRLTANYNYRKT